MDLKTGNGWVYMKHFIGRVAELKELASLRTSLRTLRQASLCVNGTEIRK